jgi:hypothetical protein
MAIEAEASPRTIPDARMRTARMKALLCQAPLHAIDQRILEEGRKSRLREALCISCSTTSVDPPDLARDPGDGG